MSDKPNKRRSGKLATAIGVFVLLGMYVAGYFALTTCWRPFPDPFVVRLFDSRWVCQAYRPLGWLEAKIRRITIAHAYPGKPPGQLAGFTLNSPVDGKELTFVAFHP